MHGDTEPFRKATRLPLRRQRFGRSAGPMEKRGDFSTGPAVLLDHAKFYSFFDLEREKKLSRLLDSLNHLKLS